MLPTYDVGARARAGRAAAGAWGEGDLTVRRARGDAALLPSAERQATPLA
jgi:hypothetical protein